MADNDFIIQPLEAVVRYSIESGALGGGVCVCGGGGVINLVKICPTYVPRAAPGRRL